MVNAPDFWWRPTWPPSPGSLAALALSPVGWLYGAIAGARCGLGGIPEDWAAKCRYPSGTCLAFAKGLDIFAVGARLAELI